MAFDQAVSYKIYHPGVDKFLTEQEYEQQKKRSEANLIQEIEEAYQEYLKRKEKENAEEEFKETPEYKEQQNKEKQTTLEKKRVALQKAREARSLMAKERRGFKEEMRAEKMKQLQGDPEKLEKYNKRIAALQAGRERARNAKAIAKERGTDTANESKATGSGESSGQEAVGNATG